MKPGVSHRETKGGSLQDSKAVSYTHLTLPTNSRV